MKRITAMLLLICLCLMGQSVLAEEKVGKIAVAQEPTKMDYWVGEEFSAEGGVLLVTYRDKTTAEIPMTDENVKLPNVKTNTPGRKAVKVTYGGKNVTFYINELRRCTGSAEGSGTSGQGRRSSGESRS